MHRRNQRDYYAHQDLAAIAASSARAEQNSLSAIIARSRPKPKAPASRWVLRAITLIAVGMSLHAAAGSYL